MTTLNALRSNHFTVGILPPGPRNSIADVQGVRVGHATKILGDDIRTGVTLIDPGISDLFRNKIPAAVSVANGTGKVAGFTQVEELGTIEAPIALTNTLAVGPVTRGVIDLVAPTIPHRTWMDSINVIVGEINDGRINNVHENAVREEDVRQAANDLRVAFLRGSVGGGTGARAFSWKGGIGTASRVVPIQKKRYTIGALVQTNYGGALTILGVPVGTFLGKTDYQLASPPINDGSCMIIIATDAPLTARQLKRIASRTFVALARTGAIINHTSGDYAIAFTTNRQGLEGSGEIGACLPESTMPNFFLAAIEATEEGIYDAIFSATTLSAGPERILEALPIETVLPLLQSAQLPQSGI